MHEVAPLPSIFEHERAFAAFVGAAEDAGNSRVWGVARHPRSVHVVIAQCGDGCCRVFPCEGVAQTFLGEFGCGVDVARVQPVILWHRLWDQRLVADRTGGFVAAGLEVVAVPWTWSHHSVDGAAVAAFAVDDHARRQNDPTGELGTMQRGEHGGGAGEIAANVFLDVAEVDSETDLGCLMADCVDTGEDIRPHVVVPNVCPPIAGRRRQSTRLCIVRRRVQVVDHDDLMAECKKLIDDMRTDEPRAAGDNDLHSRRLPSAKVE